MIDQSYIESMRAWVKGMDVTVRQLRLTINYHDQEIKLHNEMAELLRKQLKHDADRLAQAKEDLEKYLNENQTIQQ